MTTPLTPLHFAGAMQEAAEAYNTPISTTATSVLFKALIRKAPSMTCELFDYAMGEALCSCRFMPRLVDILDASYERSTVGLPPMPDIDPRYADAYQQSAYYRALDTRERAKAAAPIDTSKPKEGCRQLAALPSSNGRALAAAYPHP